MYTLSLPSIINLLFTGSPAAIAWLVISVVIWVTIQAFTGRPWTHVSIELIEIFPSFAKFNTSSSVVVPRMEFRICAAFNCMTPTAIFRPDMSALGSSVKHVMARLISTIHRLFEQNLFYIASATNCFIAFFLGEGIPHNYLLRTTVASAQPSRATFSCTVSPLKNDELSEPFTAAIYKSCTHKIGVYHGR